MSHTRQHIRTVPVSLGPETPWSCSVHHGHWQPTQNGAPRQSAQATSTRGGAAAAHHMHATRSPGRDHGPSSRQSTRVSCTIDDARVILSLSRNQQGLLFQQQQEEATYVLPVCPWCVHAPDYQRPSKTPRRPRQATHARVPRVPTGHARAGAPHKTPEMGVGSRCTCGRSSVRAGGARPRPPGGAVTGRPRVVPT